MALEICFFEEFKNYIIKHQIDQMDLKANQKNNFSNLIPNIFWGGGGGAQGEKN